MCVCVCVQETKAESHSAKAVGVPISPPCIISAVSYADEGGRGWQLARVACDMWINKHQYLSELLLCASSAAGREPSLCLYVVFSVRDKCLGPLRGKEIFVLRSPVT